MIRQFVEPVTKLDYPALCESLIRTFGMTDPVMNKSLSVSLNDSNRFFRDLGNALFNGFEQFLENDRLKNEMVDLEHFRGRIPRGAFASATGKDDQLCVRFERMDIDSQLEAAYLRYV